MVAPRMSRQHAAGAVSARGLLLTVLGEFVLPVGGQVWTSSLIDVLARLGVEEKATRQALMRTAAAGWLSAERHGRRTRWQLTPSAETLLRHGTRRIYGFTAVTRDWDGRIVLILARVPETDRATRQRLGTRLSWAGFGTPTPGVWMSTHTERASEVERLLAEAEVRDARIFVAEHHGGAALGSMVRQAWDLDAVADSYRDFIAEFTGASTSEPLARTVELVHAWRRFPLLDPALPAELLPANWVGVRAARLFEQRHARWAPAATAEWAALD